MRKTIWVPCILPAWNDKSPVDAAYWYLKQPSKSRCTRSSTSACFICWQRVEQSDEAAVHWLHAAADRATLRQSVSWGRSINSARCRTEFVAAELHTIAQLKAILRHRQACRIPAGNRKRSAQWQHRRRLCMAKKFDHGLGTSEDTAQVYACCNGPDCTHT